MSIQVLRDGQIERRRNEKQASLRRRSSRLRALNAVTAALTHHVGLPCALYTDFDAIPPPPLTPQEATLLDNNDLNKGRYFQETSFPFSLDTVKNALATAFPAAVADEHVSQQPIASDPRSTTAQTPLPTVAEIEPQSQRTELNDDAESATSARGEGVGNTREDRALQPTQAEARHDEKDRVRVSQEAPSSPSTAAPTTGATPIRTETSPDTSVEGQGAARAPSPAPVDADPTPASEPTTTSPKTAKQDLDGDVTIPDASTVSPADKPSPAPNALAQPTQQQLPIQADATPRPTKFNEIASESTLEQQAPSMPATKPQRMQTRVSSGAMRQKSVSEIIQESPRTTPRRKPPPLTQEPSSSELAISRPPSSSRPHSQSMPAPPLPTRQSLTLTSDHVDADLSLPLDDDAYASLRGASDDSSRDYLEPLYRIQAQEPPNARGLGELLHRASKSINTGDQFIAYRERQDQRLLKRVYGLQYSNHWSLRQMQPCAEPPAPTTHWDHVLSEMKWMRTDFRQERKEKKVLAKYFAEQCADWVGAEPAMRFEMQVRTKVPGSARSEEFHDAPQSPAATSLENGDAKAPQDDDVPDLEPSSKEAQSPSSSQDMPPTPKYAAVPDAFFTAAGMSELTSHMLDSDEFIKAIQELPLFTPFDHEAIKDQRAANPANGWPPSVSKYITGKVLAKTSPAPKKRSRFDYEDEYPEDERGPKRQRASEGDGLAPEQTDVALFDSEYKSIKDRLHATNIFRPPSEFNMPSEKFYEWRLASQWTHDDDQKLKKLAKEYTFNWSLIADQMRLPSHFHGAADRRTPWECFERWVELETLPLELRKTNYFRAWVSRLESAARLVDAKYQAQLQLHSQNPNPTQPPMKRRTMPVRVERRRTGRYLHIIDAMRKLARKREQQAHKQHEAQKAANMRKNHTEPAQPKTNIHTPQEFSKLRHERDLQLAARQERMREAMLAQQKAAQMQRAGQHSNPQAAMAAQQPRQGNVQMAQGQNGQIPNMQGQVNIPGQPRQMNGVQGMPMQTPGGHLAVPNMGMQNGVPQAQMQPNMRSPGAGPNQISQEAINRMSMQNQMKNATQMSAQQMKQYQQQQMLSPGGNQAMNGMMQNGQVPNNQSAMLAAMQQQQQGNQSNMNNMQTHSAQQMNGSHTSMSPHMPPPSLSQPKQLSSGHVPAINQIKHRIQIANPGASPQQIDQMANEEMKQRLARQSATNAATGNYGNVNKQNMNAYDQNSQAFMQNNQGNGQNLNGQVNNFSNMAQGNMAQGNNQNQASPSQAQQQQYSHMMRQQLMAQRQQLSSSGMNNNGSPRLQSVGPANTQSPVNMHVSPVMQGAMPNMSGVNMNGMNGMNMGQMNGMNGMSGGNNQQRPPSRNATPGMVRIPSSNGIVSPGLPHQGSPRAQMVKQ
ncbi:putative chromatin modification-related protein eaf1 [Elsinoe australis]|uniref:Vacuolar import and degradation protein 21 n=1 Tax=Elsinoe australis TaxID=40998 RepID=A0A4U7B4C1_9PEZI|nr:putative chromatin modification-related protein eaf1 [Elsinoe australis]